MNNILLVVVLYNESLQKGNTYRSLIGKYPELPLFVYDNSPEPQAVDLPGRTVHYVHDPSNPGVSRAYNEGARYAAAHGYQWLLLLDQDTCFPGGMMEAYEIGMRSYPDIPLFVPKMTVSDGRYMSPVKNRRNGGKLEKKASAGRQLLSGFSPVNSGMMILTDAFIRAGGYNDAVKLDLSDYQFIARFRNCFREFYILDVDVQQDFSDKTQSRQQKWKRFELFCESARNYEKAGQEDKISPGLIVFRRMLSLTASTRSFKPMKTYLKYYLKR